jgi:hypothetical protein
MSCTTPHPPWPWGARMADTILAGATRRKLFSEPMSPSRYFFLGPAQGSSVSCFCTYIRPLRDVRSPACRQTSCF